MFQISFLGIDHGTQAVRFFILPDNYYFEISRKNPNFNLLKKIDDFDIKAACITYSMGDAINKITNIKKVVNRGVLEESVGEYKGVGTKIFDFIAKKEFETYLIPGLHRNLDVLDRRFRALYSHCASADKVALSYCAYKRVNEDFRAKNLIISDISSNTVTIAIKDDKFFGAIDACLGAIGIFHGPLDLDGLRRAERGERATKIFYSSGAVKIYPTEDPNEILEPKNELAELALESLIMSVKMEIYGFLSEVDPDAIVITGWAGIHENVFKRLKNLENIAPLYRIDKYSAARGASLIAREVYEGADNILGIGVER